MAKSTSSAKKIWPENETAKKVEFGGLCTTCNSNDSCTYPRSVEKPVIDCEEFGDATSENNLQPSGNVRQLKKTAELETVEESELKGLCKNCGKRGDCAFTKPAAGIWHCEEYE